MSRILWRPGSAINLAVLRITLCVVSFGPAARSAIEGRASVEALPTVAPSLLGPVLVELPRDPTTLRIVAGAFALSCLAGALGLRTRWAMAGVLVFGAYHLGIPQIFGKVDHSHHVLWIALILAMAPCGDALSVDSWGRRRDPSIRYGFPLRVTWLVIGLTYFFAGFWKLGSVGLAWISADNLRGIMWDERLARPGFEPMLDIASSDLLLTAGAAFTIAFEIGFVFLVFGRRTRPIAVAAGLAFHLSTGLTMGIWFTELTIFYVAFINWEAILSRLDRPVPDRHPSPTAKPSPSKTSAVVLGVLAFAVVAAGFGREIDGWPVASYPDFGYRSPETKVTASVRVDGDGAEDVVLLGLGTLKRHRLLLRAASTDEGRADLVDLVESSSVCDEPAPDVRLSTLRWRAERSGLELVEETSTPLDVSCG